MACGTSKVMDGPKEYLEHTPAKGQQLLPIGNTMDIQLLSDQVSKNSKPQAIAQDP